MDVPIRHLELVPDVHSRHREHHPDSFSDGGEISTVDDAIEAARSLVEAGADLIDVGGESTRPGASVVSPSDEAARVLPVIERLAGELDVPISVDTTKESVAECAISAGAELVNDISGGLWGGADKAAARGGSVYICGHLRGESVAHVHRQTASPGYREVAADLVDRLARLPSALAGRVIVDPGMGFGKRPAENLELSKRAGDLSLALKCPVMVGPSRKRFVAAGSGVNDPSREVLDHATIGAALAAVAGGAQLIRLHNVAAFAPALRLFEAVGNAP